VLAARRADRPPLDQLTDEVLRLGYEAVGRKYSVSGVAIRKWFLAEGAEPPRRSKDRQLGDAGAARALEMLASGVPEREVAERLSVTRWSIRDLKRGRTYRHIERPAALAA
jgi:hypothetical protein